MYGEAMVAQGDFYDTVTSMCSMLESRSFHLLIVFGNTTTVHSVNVMAQYLDIPVIGYSRQADDEFFQLHHPLYLSLMPSKAHLAEGLARLMSVNYWYRYTMVIQEEIKDDGFHVELKSLTQTQNWDIEEELIISNTATDNEIANQLVPIGNNNSRIFVLHTSAHLAMRILDQANRLHFTGQEFAWIVTENAYTRNTKDLQHFPPGTLAFMLNLALNEDELLKDTMTLITTAIKERRHLGSSMSLNQKKGCWHLQNHEKSPMDNKLYKALIDTTIYGLTGSLKFDTGGYLNISSFKVRNLVFDGRGNVWRDIGCIQGDDVRPFGIIWPGDASSPDSKTQGRKRYRVVTNPVQPFVMQEAPHKDYQRCVTDTTCLKLFSKDKAKTIAAIRDYEQQIYRENKTYEIHCCRGLAIDLLNKLASDLDFDFTLFIVQDETYGRKVNGSWNGMVRDLMDGTAHFAVGAFSITRVRSEVIDFTDPYFFSGFSILYSEKTRETNMDAFLEPFALQVWFAIFVSATLSAIAMALFEWNSPFGLNPWGRKRKSNYTLASGLTMVYSVLFGHTVKTKSPKAWPSKVMQNFWAFAAIFIIASYTANLAAFIAGKHAGIDYTDIGDSRLLDIRIGLLPGSAVGGFLEKISSKLYAMSTAVPTTDTAIEMIIGEKIDAYLGDYPILDYARAHLAPRCELKLLLKIFGDDRYGFGLPKGSPLKVALSRKILEYHQNSQIEDLIDVHFADSQCYKQRISQQESSLEVTHHAGLFVMMCVGIMIGIVVLFIEHGVFKWLVPYYRMKPGASFWKSSHVMFFSQRLHRSITSAELLSAHESARELIGLVKNREFARLFQKSTIRKNKLADMAKTKRINRNFYDIVEKAKWLHEMREMNLMDDGDDDPPPTIIEIPLKDLGAKIDSILPKPADE
ncbi:glutamate receptor ionotropic, NMDA 3A-like [Patella vulgata]|uniref:glutamate receptor ionotropic, NMDA 3A-like n=1 Tax=Patella vulgata TaxID=6465 RepID=UPI0024A934C7|nr:glutamate receptor ionotropic, NMDA 3A-like [Patella vulgata]